MKLFQVLCALPLILTPGLSAKADPDPVVRYFMGESVSIWIYGLNILERSINATISPSEPIFNAHRELLYDSDTNQIRISASLNITSDASWKEECKRAVAKLRGSINIYDFLFSFSPNFEYDVFFPNKENKNEPKGWPDSLLKITHINLIFIDNSSLKSKEHKCIAPLLFGGDDPTSDILFSE